MARAPTALLLEDEPLLREALRTSLAKLWPELEVTAETGDGDEALARLLATPTAIAFLDIRVPGTSGIEIARRFAGKVHVVFVTAHGEFAIEAFERGAADYVLKPINLARLATTVERLKGRLGSAPRELRPELLASLERIEAATAPVAATAAHEPQREPTRWLQATVGHQTKLITIREVLYFQSDSKYTRVVRANDEALIRKSLVELLETIDPQQFWQIHRGTLVNTEFIESVIRDGLGGLEVVLKGRNERLKVSRSFRHLFKGM
ncbi:MAG: response regulator transcription factor [Burkholderiales bacterium]|nr:response regulator transcription factor [Burkholderiales bacterium]